jgi:RNA polymerase sigma-70 factor (ECF subfamily)
VEQHYSTIYGYAYRLSGVVADAEDLTQQTFMIAHQKLHQVREQDKVVRWLYTITRTCFLKSRRRQRPSAATNYELDVNDIPAAFPADSPFDEERLQSALNELGDEFKVCLTMFYFEELSYKEIGEQLEIPIGTVMSRLARAKGRLRYALADASETSSPAQSHGKEVVLSQPSAENQCHHPQTPIRSPK